MKDLYSVAAISKQALHQSRKRQQIRDADEQKFFEQAATIRQQHPGAGCRKMALDMRSHHWGRDKLEALLLRQGYRLSRRRNFTRTTYAQRLYHYPNLIEGLEVNNIHQVVQTDITYYRVKEKFYYLTFFVDVYSRYIGGYAVSNSLGAAANIKALKMLLKGRGNNHAGLIHHSDKGSQYIDQDYRKILKDNKVKMSMCDEAWQNAYSERINRTIKEEYLDGWEIDNEAQLKKAVARAVEHYNQKRRHRSLDWQTPSDFERQLRRLKPEERKKQRIYKQQAPM